MTRSEKLEFITLRKKGKLRKKAEISRLWQLDQMWIEEKVEAALEHYSAQDIINAVTRYTKRDDQKDLQQAFADKVMELANGGSTVIVNGLNLDTHERLMNFVEANIHTSCNMQSEFVFG